MPLPILTSDIPNLGHYSPVPKVPYSWISFRFLWAFLSESMCWMLLEKILGTSVFPAASLPQPSQSSRTIQEPAGWAGHPVPRPALSGGRMESHMPSALGWPLNRVGSHVLPVTREGQPNRSTVWKSPRTNRRDFSEARGRGRKWAGQGRRACS